MTTAVLVGSLDTKGDEYAFVRDRLVARGVSVLTVDTGVLGSPAFVADFPREEVASAAGVVLQDLVTAGDRGAAVTAMAHGATAIIVRLYAEGRLDGALALGGTGGTSSAATAFRELPLGVPKIIVSTAASGNTVDYVGETDLVLMPSVVDVAGLNRISTRILANAADALAGMLTGAPLELDEGRPLIGASMFGVTTPCVTRAREVLEQLGYEVVVFHMTGAGGRTMERLVAEGFFAGLLDVTTTELADHLVGGVFDAGEGRLEAAARAGVPQVVSVGALDMVNFGPLDSVPAQFADRNLYVHNATTTLMRTTPDECAELGRRLAAKITSSTGPTAVFLPLGGVSAIAVPGGAFADADADERLFDAVRAGMEGSGIPLVELDLAINDPAFAEAIATELDRLVRQSA